MTYVSRLQCVQAAVDHQIRQIAKAHPKKKVAIVSFASDVQVIGDGSKHPVVSLRQFMLSFFF